MTDQRSFERFVADQVTDHSGGIPMPDDFYDDMHSFASDTRQRPEWLAVIKEPPMRTNTKLAVGSPTVRVAAVLAATFLLAVALAGIGVAGQRLLASEGTIIVAQDGSGDYTTISEAVAAANVDDTIHVRPGEYLETIEISKDITLAGDGPREEIVVSPAEGDDILSLIDSDADVSNLTLRGQGANVTVSGGAPTLHALTFTLEGEPCTDMTACLFDPDTEGVSLDLEDTAATVMDSEFIGRASVRAAGQSGESAPLLEGNRLSAGTGIVVDDFGPGGVIRRNIIDLPQTNGISLGAQRGDYLIEGNTIANVPSTGIDNGSQSATHIVRDNVIRGARVAIRLDSDALTISGNELIDNETAITIDRSESVIEGNLFCGNGQDIVADGEPVTVDSTINELCESDS